MNVKEFYGQPDEKPLDRIIDDAGYCGIFKTIGCIGDSLASGEFESLTEDGIVGWHDCYDYAWAHYIALKAGSKLYNFSRGGMTACEFMNSYAAKVGTFQMENRCQCYILALGVNDIGDGSKLGSADTVAADAHRKTEDDSFADYYAEIIKRLKTIQPKAKFFLMTIPRSDNDEKRAALEDKHAEIVRGLADKFNNAYVIDLRKYGPVYDAEFKKNFFLAGHMNPMGYILTSKMVISYIDYIIRHNMEDFAQLGFVGTPYKNANAKW